MRVALISPKGPLYRHRGGIFKKSLRYAPLTLVTLAALVPDDVHASIEIIDEGIEDVPLDLQADQPLYAFDADSALRAAVISRSIQAFANAQSFFTVRSDTPNASATSETPRPA